MRWLRMWTVRVLCDSTTDRDAKLAVHPIDIVTPELVEKSIECYWTNEYENYLLFRHFCRWFANSQFSHVSMSHGHAGNRRTINNMLYRSEEEIPSAWQGKLIIVKSSRIYELGPFSDTEDFRLCSTWCLIQ